MVAFADIEAKNNRLVRKALRVVVAFAPFSAPPLTSIVDDTTGELVALPTEFKVVGWTSEDGITWPRETEVSDIYGHGAFEPLRSDIRRSTKQLTVTPIEDNKVVEELYLGQSLDAAVTSLNGNETTYDEPQVPVYPYGRLIAIARDVTDSGDYYKARHFLRTRVTAVGEESWQDGDTPVSKELTFTAFQDPAEGTGVRHFRAGPGRAQLAEEEGFPAPA